MPDAFYAMNTACLIAIHAPHAQAAVPEPQWEHSALETVEAHQFYNAVGRTGIKYGPRFRMVQRTNISADTSAVLRCALLPYIVV